jgi:tetratricopeptide (TPR) repeat protein
MTSLSGKHLLVGLLLLLLTAMPATAPGAESNSSESGLDPEWSAQNQEVLSLIKEKKVDKALSAGRKMMSYLRRNQLLKGEEAATTFNNMGMIYLSKGQFDLAHQFLSKALQLRTELFGPQSIEVATVWLNLSQLYKLQAEHIFKLHQKSGEQP